MPPWPVPLCGTDADAVVREISAAFLRYDTGSKGYLTRHEVRCVHLYLLGYEPSLTEMDILLPKRPDGRAHMELPELCEVMAPRLCSQDVDDLVRCTFRAFDTLHKGYVSLEDLQHVVAAVAPHLPQRTISLVFSKIDTDSDGRISYKDFTSMMRSPTLLR